MPVATKPGTIATNGVIHAAPPSATTTIIAGGNSVVIDPQNPSSGLAYYDKLRKELRDLIARKKQVDKNLEQLEDHIYKFETSYLEETQNGNIVRGFDNYIKGTVARRRAAISDSDRIFSMSSHSFMKAREEAANNPPVSAGALPDTAGNTPIASSSVKTGGNKKGNNNKKKRKGGGGGGGGGAGGGGGGANGGGGSGAAGGDGDDSESPSEVDTPGPKRVRISFSGQAVTAEK